ncbi:MAG TPA: hypothetical protein PK147_09150, partial [Saprospiraceae bacterium]|nr:hypothetical protein [Saprospiraceae bacterium]
MKKILTNLFILFLLSFYQSSKAQTLDCQSNLSVSLDAYGDYHFAIEELILNVDVSGETIYEISPQNLSCSDIGTVEVVVTAISIINGNSIDCSVMVLVEDKMPPVVVTNMNVNVTIPQSGVFQLTPDMIDQSSYDNCGIASMSIEPQMVDCSDVGNTITAVLTVEDVNGNTNTSWTEITVSDKIKPTPYFLPMVTILVNSSTNCIAQIFPEDLDLGSYDNCTQDLIFSMSQSVFTCNDIGKTIPVTITVFDESGNSDYANCLIKVEGMGITPCTGNMACNDGLTFSLELPPGDLYPSIVLTPGDFLAGAYPGCDMNQFLMQVYIGSQMLEWGYGSVTLTQPGEYFMAITEPSGNTCWSNFTILDTINFCTYDEINFPPNLSIDAPGITQLEIDNDALSPESLMLNFSYSLEETKPTWEDCEGLMGYSYEDQIFYYGQDSFKILRKWSVINWSIYDPVSGFGLSDGFQTILINNSSIVNCNFNSVMMPHPKLFVSQSTINTDILTPEDLINNFGFALEMVIPTFSPECANFSYFYEDEIVNNNEPFAQIIREFSVLNWYNGQLLKSTQIIYINYGQYICDFLPNSTPFTDCMLGHSATDDVEWPDDIWISDYHLEPNDLVTYSGIDEADSRPILFNQPQAYRVEKTDILDSLNQSTIFITRKWTVTLKANENLTWNYNQGIVVDLTSFVNLVNFSSYNGIPIENVLVNNSYSSNAQGNVFVEEDIQQLEYVNDNLNAFTIRDLVILQNHILGLNPIENEIQLKMADANKDEKLTASDLAQIRKNILEIYDLSVWGFYQIHEDSQLIGPKAQYIVYKTGDVDGSAFLDNQTIGSTDIYSDDLLLNAGEEYTIPIYCTENIESRGYQLKIPFDDTKIEIKEILSPYLGDSIDPSSYNIKDGKLIWGEIYNTNNFYIDGGLTSDQATAYVSLQIKA